MIWNEKRRQLMTEITAIRAKRNQHSRAKDNDPEIGRQIRSEISKLEERLDQVQVDYDKYLAKVPNLPSADTPIGPETNNKILNQFGSPPSFNFEPKPHWEMTGFIDQERATRISGSRFAFIVGDLVLLQFALIRYGIDCLTNQNFIEGGNQRGQS